MHPRALIMAVALALVTAACGVSSQVATERADPIGAIPGDLSVDRTLPQTDPAIDPNTAPTTVPDPTDDPASPPTTSEATTAPGGTVPSTSAPAPTAPPSTVTPEPIDDTLIDFGENTPPQATDDFLLAVMTDLERWWSEQYPAIYGAAHRPLEGGVFAAHPQRISPIPGCGEPRTSYEDVQQFVAFYCGVGDFIVFDYGPSSLLTDLSNELGPGTIGIVLAHEYGHAIQLRSGALDRALATVRTEQQADCFAGAWAARAARGEAITLTFDDADVRAGLIAMTEVADPVGLDQLSVGGHGSAFDRVGAFQEGFTLGPARCAEILDDPLPLMPNQFASPEDLQRQGDAPLDFGTSGLLTFLPTDLNLYWDVEVGDQIFGFDGLTLQTASAEQEIDCLAPSGDFERGTVLCRESSTVWLNLPRAEELWDRFGDFSVGFLLGMAWSEAVQQSIGSELVGEARELANDCLTGAWVNTVTPIDFVLPQPRADGRDVSISPGDLDEAIQTAILIGDLGSDDDMLGSAFEKIASFRVGVLDGLDPCLADL